MTQEAITQSKTTIKIDFTFSRSLELSVGKMFIREGACIVYTEASIQSLAETDCLVRGEVVANEVPETLCGHYMRTDTERLYIGLGYTQRLISVEPMLRLDY